MPASRWPLRDAIARLEQLYGTPTPLQVTDPFELVLWECCAYLVDDARRAKVYGRLVAATGANPEAIAGMRQGVLSQLISQDGGMQPGMRAEKLQRAANLALELGQDRLRTLCRKDSLRARPLLKRFPGIGEPGADRILMVAGSLKTLAPDSNGVRVLCRLGFGKQDARYDRMYRSVVAAVEPELPATRPGRIKAHQLLREHGKTLCKTTAPRCEACPLAPRCPSARAAAPLYL